MRANKKRQNEVLLQDTVGKDGDGRELKVIDRVGSDCDDVFAKVETKLRISELYEKISTVLEGREREIMRLRYGLCGGTAYTQKEIARYMGISRSYVSRIEKKALGKLACAMNANSSNPQ